MSDKCRMLPLNVTLKIEIMEMNLSIHLNVVVDADQNREEDILILAIWKLAISLGIQECHIVTADTHNMVTDPHLQIDIHQALFLTTEEDLCQEIDPDQGIEMRVVVIPDHQIRL